MISPTDKTAFLQDLARRWEQSPRWRGIERPFSPEDVFRLAGRVRLEFTLARMGAERLWALLQGAEPVRALSAVTGNQAIQEIRAGLASIYVSGWQVAADANLACQVYPDQSLYPSDSVPQLIERINNALLRADQIDHLNERNGVYWLAPIVADAEAGFGGSLHAFEIMKMMIAAGAAGVHFEDQLASVKKCGHLGGKVLVPTSEFVNKLVAARLAADVCGVDTLLIARTDANGATLLTSDSDPYDHAFLDGRRSPEGFFGVRNGLEAAVARGMAYASYADLLWFETGKPDLGEAREFAAAIHERYPGKLLAYNCSPSFNWRKNLDDVTIGRFQDELGEMGYRYQFVTLSGFHSLNHSMFRLARAYARCGMAAYAQLQDQEFQSQEEGYTAVKHQEFVGTGYFDEVTRVATSGESSTLSMEGSTEREQF